MPETLLYTVIGVGLAFDLLGCLGLVRLPDVYNRAQAATKCVTLGTCLILVGTAGLVFARADPATGVKAILCAGFVLMTSPVAAHAICRGAYLRGVPLCDRSVEDAFVERAERIRAEQAEQGVTSREEAETA